MTMLAFVLYLLLYALIAVLVIELVCYILALFLVIPPKVKQLLYAIVGVVLLIYVLQFALSGATIHPLR